MAAPTVKHADEMQWQASPSPGVDRKRFELDGPVEAGRVTSLVRYAPGSVFPSHPHPDGEEILVLKGVFSDERGDHPSGIYMLNPEGYEHAPRSERGCVLFVKLRQYPGLGRTQVRIDSMASEFEPHPHGDGVEIQPLYGEEGHPETVHLLRLASGSSLDSVEMPGGEEIFVLAGSFRDEHGSYREGSWVKYAPGSKHSPSSADGCTLYIKKNHLG